MEKNSAEYEVEAPNGSENRERTGHLIMKLSAKGPTGSINDNDKEGDLFMDSVEATPVRSDKTTDTSRKLPPQSPRARDGDVNRTESQQFIDLVKYGSKKDSIRVNKYLKNFEVMIDDQEDDIRRIVNNRIVDSSSREAAFYSNFRSIYSSSTAIEMLGQRMDQPLEMGCNISGQLQCQRGTVVFANAMNLRRVFQRSTCRLESQTMSYSVTSTWDEDMRSLHDILEAGRDVGCSKVKNVVNNSGTMNENTTMEVPESCDKEQGIAERVSWTMATREKEEHR